MHYIKRNLKREVLLTMKLSKIEKAMIYIAAAFILFTSGYFAGKSMRKDAFVVETSLAQMDNESDAIAETTAVFKPAVTEKSAEEAKININTADAGLLNTLPGIGDVLAGRVIAYREENGDFVLIDEIMDVEGIGEAIFSNIKDIITVG